MSFRAEQRRAAAEHLSDLASSLECEAESTHGQRGVRLQ